MQAVAMAEAKPAAVPSNGPDLKQVFRNAQRAFDLIQKHRTPPDPKTYAVWYAYVEATDTRVIERVDHAIAANGTLTPYDISAIFQELLTEEPASVSARHTIGMAIEKEIDEVMKIIQQGVQNSDDFGASLDKANEELPGAASGDQLATLVSTLMEDNKRMAETTRELNQGLMESQKQIATLNQELEEVQTQCMRDPLTAIANRRAFDERLEREVCAAAETGEKLCLALADIDHFKNVNDTYGHQVGDAVLQQFAAVVTQNIKGQDMVARYGGEEFAIILPETDLFSAYNLLVKIKYNFKSAETPIEGTLKTLKDVTASFGLVRFEPGMTPRDMIEQADNFLYEAKHAGRDRVKAKGF
ncbi:GGDEF domain-containing protein [Hyphomonas adhaerens]|uniref:GGDEF domain-containing protein n=1 Tax=Hyphomonas adhaerens TaxID=81029 RepID=UPI002353FFE2|nr:GGDEF domain-containing protein [Hyphomonas adhaerens]